MSIQPVQTKPASSSVDRAILQEYNAEIRRLTQDMNDIKEMQGLISTMVVTHSEPLKACEEKTAQAFENTIKGTQDVQKASEIKGDRNRFIVFIGGGSAAGVALGAIGFAINPIVGVISMVAMGGVGAIVGTIVTRK